MRILRSTLVLAVIVTLTGLGQQAPQPSPDVVARFHINDADYLADVGKYLEALEELDTAYNYSESAAIKAEALSSKAVLLSGFLDNPQAAILQYDTIIQNFAAPPSYEPALFQSAMLRFDAGDAPNARALFQRYLREFPSGAQKLTAEFMLDRTPPSPKPAPPAVQQVRGRTIRIALEAAASVTLASSQGLTVAGKTVGPSAGFESSRLNGETLTVESNGPIRVGARAYRGKIVLMPEGDLVRVVNEIAVEEYLYSVVASEVPSTWPAEALKAQAVAARTYAYYHVTHPRSPGKFDLFDDTRSQEYGGYARETSRTREAVDATRGQVLQHNGRLILAYFTSNNGGSTGDPEFIFGAAYPYLKAVTDTVSPSEPNGKWTRSFRLADVESALQKSGYPVSGIRGIVPVKTCPSGRLVELAIEHSKGRITLNTRTQFRRAINDNIRPGVRPENLPEILMSITITGTGGRELSMSGGGWGHGVGMSQYGARGMARNGSSYKEILSKYYIGAELKTLS